MIYLFICLYILFLAFSYDFGNLSKGKKVNKILVFIILVALAGFRYRVGGDTYFYMYWYDILPNLSELNSLDLGIEKFQPLWIFINAISKSISKEFYAFQIIHAIFINSVIFHFFYKYTRYFFTGIFLYFIGFYGYFNFEILRESIAVCIFLLALEAFQNRRWWKYYTFAIIAFGFHFSAIFIFFIPILKKIPVSTISVFFYLILGLLLNKIFVSILNLLPLSSVLVFLLKAYSEYNYTIWGLISIILLFVLYPIIVLKISINYLRLNSHFHSLMKIYIFIGSLTTMFFVFFRFLNYLTPIFFIILTEFLHGFFRKQSLKPFRMAIITLAFLIISSAHISRYFNDTSDKVSSTRWYSYWYPYYSIFNEKKDPTREKLYENF